MCFSSVIILCFKCQTVKFRIASFLAIIRINIAIGFVLVSRIIIIIRLLNEIIRIIIMVTIVFSLLLLLVSEQLWLLNGQVEDSTV